MKIIPKTKKDFAWVNFTPKEIREYTARSIKKIEEDIKAVKNIPQNKRNFENTVFAIEKAGEDGSEDSPLSFLQYVSTDENVRKASKEYQEKLTKKVIDISFDKGLYKAFLDYDVTKEKISPSEYRLWKDMKTSFEDQGFHLPKAKQEELKSIKKRLSILGISFSKNIEEYHDQILCSLDDLKGLPDSYIANLKTDKKTKKYIVTLAYPESGPFMKFAESDSKRQELADKISQKGGKANIKILKEMLVLRKKQAELLGFKSYVDFEAKDLIAKDSSTIKGFLIPTIEKLKKGVDKEYIALQKHVGQKLSYFNAGFYAHKMQQDLYSYDPNIVKEYFELWHVINKMFEIFGTLFSVSFKENKQLPKWHRDAKIFDVIEKGNVVAHIGFDLYPRKNKFSHMACWPLMPGKSKGFRGKDYLAPVSVIVGNFPIGTKENPSLLSVRELETMFHEFGHAMHGSLGRASLFSQSGTSVTFDFVETPSQLFENWIRQKKNLKLVSRHWKTGKKIEDNLLDKVIKSLDFMKASQEYHTFILSLQDFEMHTDKYGVDPLVLSLTFEKKYRPVDGSPKSLFPAGWGHLVGYAAKYYAYMWALVYSYDVFSRFKKEGIMSKKVGMELRRKILEKGDSEDPIKLMTDFLGRKPNNKAFLEALK